MASKAVPIRGLIEINVEALTDLVQRARENVPAFRAALLKKHEKEAYEEYVRDCESDWRMSLRCILGFKRVSFPASFEDQIENIRKSRKYQAYIDSRYDVENTINEFEWVLDSKGIKSVFVNTEHLAGLRKIAFWGPRD